MRQCYRLTPHDPYMCLCCRCSIPKMNTRDSEVVLRARHKHILHLCVLVDFANRKKGGAGAAMLRAIMRSSMCFLAESIHIHFPELDEFQICQLTSNSLTELVTTDGITTQTPLTSRASLPEGTKPPPLVYQLSYFCYSARKMVTHTREVQPSTDSFSSLPYVYEFFCRTIMRLTGQEMIWSATRNPSGLLFFEIPKDVKDLSICAVALSTGDLRYWMVNMCSRRPEEIDDQPSSAMPASFVLLTEIAPARIDAEEIMASFRQVSVQLLFHQGCGKRCLVAANTSLMFA